jgi:hypothetical protein
MSAHTIINGCVLCPSVANVNTHNIDITVCIKCCRPEEAQLLWRRSTAAFGASSHPGVRHAALRCAGAVLGRLRRLHANTPDGDTSPQSPAADAPATSGAATGNEAAAAMTGAAGLLDAGAMWLLEAAEGGGGAVAAAGDALRWRLAEASHLMPVSD